MSPPKAQNSAEESITPRQLIVREERPAAGGGGGPYPGLRPFEAKDETLFFGREEHVDALLDKLRNNRFLAVIGSSGCGKSSLVRAGLIPKLGANALYAAGSRWKVATVRPGDRPLTRLAEALYDARAHNIPHGERNASLYNTGTGMEDSEELEMRAVGVRHLRAGLRLGSDSLLHLVEQEREFDKQEGENLLILIDQFEEVFRFRDRAREAEKTSDKQEAEEFVALLLRTAQQSLKKAVGLGDPKIYVVLTMRSDYLGECQVFEGLPEMLNQSQFLTPRLSSNQLRNAIVGPALVFGAKIEPTLVTQLLKNASGVIPESDQLPLLQHALMRLWTYHAENRSDSPDHSNIIELTLADYTSIGDDIGQVLDRHADEVFGQIQQRNATTQEHTQQISDLTALVFRQITGRVAGRPARTPTSLGLIVDIAMTSVAEGRDPEVVQRDIACIFAGFAASGRNFLTSPGFAPGDLDSRIDITHEALFRQWQKLRTWMVQETRAREWYDRLERDAGLCVSGYPNLLWNGSTLKAAQAAWGDVKISSMPPEAWALRTTTPLGEPRTPITHAAALSFLTKSQRLDKRLLAGERRLSRIKWLTIIFIAIAMCLIFMNLIVAQRTTEAKKQENKSKTQVHEAKSQLKYVESQLADATKHVSEAKIEVEQAKKQVANAKYQTSLALEQSRVANAETSKAKIAAKIALDRASTAQKLATLAKKQIYIAEQQTAIARKQIIIADKQAENAKQKTAKQASYYTKQVNRTLISQLKAVSRLNDSQLSIEVLRHLVDGDEAFSSAIPTTPSQSATCLAKLAKARDAYNAALTIYTEHKNWLGAGLTLRKLADVEVANAKRLPASQARDKGRPIRKQAILQFQKLLDDAQNLSDKVEALRLISDVYDEMGHPDDQIERDKLRLQADHLEHPPVPSQPQKLLTTQQNLHTDLVKPVSFLDQFLDHYKSSLLTDSNNELIANLKDDRYKKTKEGAQAGFYLGKYYQMLSYQIRQNSSSDRKKVLEQAWHAYHNFIYNRDTPASPDSMSLRDDARFYEILTSLQIASIVADKQPRGPRGATALVHAEKEIKFDIAKNEIEEMDGEATQKGWKGSVYVDWIIPSFTSTEALNRNYPPKFLHDVLQTAIKPYDAENFDENAFNDLVQKLINMCSRGSIQ